MIRGKWIIVLCCALLLIGCGGRGPQRPSQRMGSAPQPDSAQLALLELNQQLALTADKQLMQTAQASGEAYALYEGNTWICFLQRGDVDSPAPQANEEWQIHLSVYSLDKRLLTDSEHSYTFGRHELPAAVESNQSEWRHGTQARMLVPWYSGYGIRGTDAIAPYENIIIEIELR